MSALTANVLRPSSCDEFQGIDASLTAAGRVAASIAHEINNPLEAVTNCMYLMNQAQMDETARHYLKVAERELNRIVHITALTLGFHRQSTRAVETNVHELLESVISIFEGRLTSNAITITRHFAAIPDIVVYDSEVRQVLACILANAIDAIIPHHRGRILIRTACTRDWFTGREGISITVGDNGSGMDRVTANRVFEPFFSTKNHTRSGLGLWVSLGILQKHNGSIRLRTRSGDGTVFRIFLPTHATTGHSKIPVMSTTSH